MGDSFLAPNKPLSRGRLEQPPVIMESRACVSGLSSVPSWVRRMLSQASRA